MPTFCVKACSKNSPQRFNRCSLYCPSLSFCFCLASFAFSFRKHSSLCSFQGLSKTCSAKSQNTAKVIFRTRLKDRTKSTNRTQTKLLSSLPSLLPIPQHSCLSCPRKLCKSTAPTRTPHRHNATRKPTASSPLTILYVKICIKTRCILRF